MCGQVFFQVGDTVQPVRREPFVHLVKCKEETVKVTMTVGFHAHYGEPALDQTLTVSKGQGE